MNILLFRRDLRLSDNEIVTLAAADDQTVLPCFIIDPWFYQHSEVGKARVKFLFQSLENLDANLQKLGSRLYLFEGSSVATVQALTLELLQQGYRPKLYFNKDVQVQYGVERDRSLLNFYQDLKLEYHTGCNNFLTDEENQLDQWSHQYYSYQDQPEHVTPKRLNTPQLTLNLPQLTISELKQKYSAFWQVDNRNFTGGETHAQATLKSFLRHRYQGYHWKLSRPWLAQQGGTSHLSPHLTFGTISTRQVFRRTKALMEHLQRQPKAVFSLKAFVDRLRWHDSFTQRLYFHPEMAVTNRYPEFDQWYHPGDLSPEKQEIFLAWQEGQTGFPMVDASMRQLETMGWMNFRMRAMCATFLTINCGISWHHGARHYMNHLIDGDVAIDHWQWQMQSGVTNPLSDTFRIYNPTTNLKDRDSDLKFVYHWIPELRGYSLPELLDGTYLSESPYAAPILDWSQTRKVNGKIVSDLRKRVRERLLQDRDSEYEQAAIALAVVDNYWVRKDKQYQEYKRASSLVG